MKERWELFGVARPKLEIKLIPAVADSVALLTLSGKWRVEGGGWYATHARHPRITSNCNLQVIPLPPTTLHSRYTTVTVCRFNIIKRVGLALRTTYYLFCIPVSLYSLLFPLLCNSVFGLCTVVTHVCLLLRATQVRPFIHYSCTLYTC